MFAPYQPWWSMAASSALPVVPGGSKYDAIVVVSNLMAQDGTLNNESQQRVDAAIDAFSHGDAPVIVTCGWAYRVDTSLTIAEAMRNYAVELGVPESALLIETESRDTVGHAIFTKRKLAIPNGWSRLVVVTSDYHAARVREIFNFVYGVGHRIDVRATPSKNASAKAAHEHEAIKVFRDTFAGVRSGDDCGMVGRLRERHPFYNGVVHPKI